MPDRYHEIVDPTDPWLESFWLPLYRRAFPDDERVEEDAHRRAAAAPDLHVLVGLQGDQPVAMARYDVFPSRDRHPAYGYLMYMAVAEDSVSRGHGQRMFSEIVGRVRTDPARPQFIVFEVQRPDEPHTEEHHQQPDRRIDFYVRQGSLILEGVDYIQRVPGQPGVPMLIMAKPVAPNVAPTDVFSAARDLFGDDVRLNGKLGLSA